MPGREATEMETNRTHGGRQGPVMIVIVGILVAVAIAWPAWLYPLPVASDRLSFPLWLLAAMFAIAELFVLHVQVRREAQTVSLSEIPLVLALFYASPQTMLVARLVGLVVIVFHRRHRNTLKLAFNAAMFTADTMIAIAVFHAVLGHGDVLGPRGWGAAFAAAAAFGFFDGALLTFVIGSFEARLNVLEILREAFSSAAMSTAVAALGLIAVTSLAQDARIAWLLAAAGIVLVMAFRTYARLNERHLSLERLYKFSQVVTTTPDVDDVLRHVLEQARELLHAEHAAATFVSADGSPGMRVVLSPNGRLVHSSDTTGHDELERRVFHGEHALVSRDSKDPIARAYLERRGYREAIVMPLHGENSVVGTLTVADRMGAVRTFDIADARLLETVANHAGVALQKGRLIDQLRHEALHDALTGLPNRVFLRHRLREALQRQADGESIGVAAMIMDLNRFKEVNDTLGHQQGDDLLVDVSRRLVAALQPGATVARLGGDEFAVLLPDAFDPDDVVKVGRTLLGALERPFVLDKIAIDVGASIGIALAPEHAADSSELLKCADLAMYAAKSSGVGLCVYDDGLDHSSPEDLALLGELRQAITRGELTVHVQPKAELRTGNVSSVEALVRWEHPYRGMLPPDAFVPAAERSDLIRPLTLSVLSMGIAACAAWRTAGHDIGIAVNVSARSLLDPTLPDDIARLLDNHGVPPRLLTIELTESSVMTDPVRTIELLTRLHDMGVRLSVDDFGTGYSSLSYLKRLPVDEVKIDRGFVSDMQHNADDSMIVRSIIDLGANLSLSVVAEGVEDVATWHALGRFGCEYAQGFHLSRPLPLEVFLPWLARYEGERTAFVAPRTA